MARESFWPEETSTQLYIERCGNGKEILGKIQAKWPGIKLEEFEMEAEYTHTSCLTYDLYDSSDYTNFLCITASAEYFDRISKEREDSDTKREIEGIAASAGGIKP